MRVLTKGPDTLSTGQVTVTNTATLIKAANVKRRALLVVQHGTTDVFIGNSGVTAANGLLLSGTKGASLSIPGTMAVYGIVASGTQDISFIEVENA